MTTYFYLANQYGTRRSHITDSELVAEGWQDEAVPNFPGEIFDIIEEDSLKAVPAEWIENKEIYPAFCYVVNEHGALRSPVASNPDDARKFFHLAKLAFPKENFSIQISLSKQDIPDFEEEPQDEALKPPFFFVINEEGLRRSHIYLNEVKAVEFMDTLFLVYPEESFAVTQTDDLASIPPLENEL